MGEEPYINHVKCNLTRNHRSQRHSTIHLLHSSKDAFRHLSCLLHGIWQSFHIQIAPMVVERKTISVSFDGPMVLWLSQQYVPQLRSKECLQPFGVRARERVAAIELGRIWKFHTTVRVCLPAMIQQTVPTQLELRQRPLWMKECHHRLLAPRLGNTIGDVKKEHLKIMPMPLQDRADGTVRVFQDGDLGQPQRFPFWQPLEPEKRSRGGECALAPAVCHCHDRQSKDRDQRQNTDYQ